MNEFQRHVWYDFSFANSLHFLEGENPYLFNANEVLVAWWLFILPVHFISYDKAIGVLAWPEALCCVPELTLAVPLSTNQYERLPPNDKDRENKILGVTSAFHSEWVAMLLIAKIWYVLASKQDISWLFNDVVQLCERFWLQKDLTKQQRCLFTLLSWDKTIVSKGSVKTSCLKATS